jgi:hypothetical protein
VKRTPALLGAAIAIALVPSTARAQSQPPAGAPGPLVLERLDNGFAVTPDFKLTRLDGHTDQLLGVDAGWVQENTLFVGGGLYSLLGHSNRELTYGGFIIGWDVPEAHRYQVGVRGLIGFGSARLDTTVAFPARVISDGGRFSDPRRAVTIPASTVTYRLHDDVFVFEPQAMFAAQLVRRVRLNVGAGYRVTGEAEALRDRVDGATISLGLQIRLN